MNYAFLIALGAFLYVRENSAPDTAFGADSHVSQGKGGHKARHYERFPISFFNNTIFPASGLETTVFMVLLCCN